MIEFKTDGEYEEARAKADRQRAASEAAGFKGGAVPGALQDDKFGMSNDLRSAIEVWEFIRDKPPRVVCYVNLKDRAVTTWIGQKLGRIIWLGQEYTSGGFARSRRQALRVQGVNGVVYSGIYYVSSGDYCRLKKVKG